MIGMMRPAGIGPFKPSRLATGEKSGVTTKSLWPAPSIPIQ